MKKRLSKIIKVLGVFALVATILYVQFGRVDAAPNTINMGGIQLTEDYIGSLFIDIKQLTDGSYAFCMDASRRTPANQTLTLVGEQDAGLAYIMQHGFPRVSFTGNRSQDYYITQAAIWWYLDDTTSSSNLSDAWKNTMADPYGLRPHIRNLVSRAIAAREAGYPDAPTLNLAVTDNGLTLSEDRNYYVSSPITGNATDIDGNFTVSIISGPNGAVITDEAGNPRTEFAPGARFLVRVPVANVTAGDTVIRLQATASQTTYRAYEYTTGNDRYQNSIILIPETREVVSEINLYLSVNQIRIIKIDAETREALAGATLQIIDIDGVVVAEWVSTTQAHVIQNLPHGRYFLREIAAPHGYELSNEVIEIIIDEENYDIEIIFENTPLWCPPPHPEYPCDPDHPDYPCFPGDPDYPCIPRPPVRPDPCPPGHPDYPCIPVVNVPDTMTSREIVTTVFGALITGGTVGFVRFNAKKQKKIKS